MWSLAFRIGVIVTAVLLAIGLIVVALCVVAWLAARDDDYSNRYDGEGQRRDDMRLARNVAIGTLIAMLLIAAVAAGFMYPWDMAYHEIRPVSGPVQAISSRFLNQDGTGTSQKFVVRINGRDYGCNDTRCALVKPGDYLVLGCQRVWQFGSTDGYDCVYRDNKGPTKG